MPITQTILLLSLLFLALACETQAGKQPSAFDKAAFQAFYGKSTPIEFNKTKSNTIVKLAINYLFTKSNQYQHYHVVIEFSPAGTLLESVGYERAKNESRQANNPAKHEQLFPNIGRRAQYYFLGAGPGGAAEKLIFTTSDNSFDVSIIVSQLLPENIPIPDKNIVDIAKYVNTSILNGDSP